MNNLSPIVLFAFNRPEHTKTTLDALAQNHLASASDLVIYCDGPRSEKDQELVCQVREIARAAQGFKSVEVIERPENYGLARSVITGISTTLESHDTIIVLEDDLVTTPHFLEFMNEALDYYADENRVISICGYRFPVKGGSPETFFLPGAFCWGWATWRRGWELFESDASALMQQVIEEDLIYEFDFLGSDPLTQILQHTVNKSKKADSWATRWIGSAHVERKYTLYPGKSMIRNIGFDRTGRHAGSTSRFESPLAERKPTIGTAVIPPDERTIQQHWSLFAGWRAGGNRRIRWYYRIARFLPETGRKKLYSSIIRRSLQRNRAPGA